MPTPELINERRRKLQHQRGDVSWFSTHTEFQTWFDNVLPLLAFNAKFQNQLKSAAHATYINLVQEIPKGVISNINRAIGIVNQAVISLEVNSVQHAASDPSAHPTNPIKPSDNSLTIQIGVGVFIVFVGLLIGYLLKTHFGIFE